jgi:outer membrane protein assembly factor BamE
MQLYLRIIILTVLGIACLGSIACSNFPPRLYRLDIRQGNDITPEMVSKLRPGMTKEQVVEILGSPTLSHALNVDRFDYYYFFKPGKGGAIVEKHFSVFFKNERVLRWSSQAE